MIYPLEHKEALIESGRQTLAYLRLVGLAVTPEELFRYLWKPPACTYDQFLVILPEISGGIRDGFVIDPYAPVDQGDNRRRGTVPTEHMLRRARLALYFVAWIPFLEGVFVCNSVGAELATEKSDIDWFVIARSRRMWLVRACLNSMLRLLGLRTYGTKEAGRICLSFFVASDQLDLSPWGVVPDDIHFAYWLRQMMPLYNRQDAWRRFQTANQWVNALVPHATYRHLPVPEPSSRRKCSLWLQRLGEYLLRGRLGDRLEDFCTAWQKKHLIPSLQAKAQRSDKGVIIAPGVLKFHEHDTRLGIYTDWLIACAPCKKV